MSIIINTACSCLCNAICTFSLRICQMFYALLNKKKMKTLIRDYSFLYLYVKNSYHTDERKNINIMILP